MLAFMIAQVSVIANYINPAVVLLIGIAVVAILMAGLEIPAFVSLILGTIVVGFISPQIPPTEIASNLANGFGDIMTSIGIPILMAAIIAASLMNSGAAERIVRAALSVVNEEHGDVAILGSSYVLAIPVFFDNVFYLLAPIARQMRARTGDHLALYMVAIVAGAAATQIFVPPTPAPLAASQILGINLGLAIGMGVVIALVTSIVAGYFYGHLIDRRLDVPLREAMGSNEADLNDVVNQPTESLPGLGESLAPIIIAVVFVASSTVAGLALADESVLVAITAVLGDPNIALTAAAILAMITLYRFSSGNRTKVNDRITEAIRSGGNIIAITAAGGAFGAMLSSGNVGAYFVDILRGAGIPVLLTAWLMATVLIVATGSGTVAMLTTANIMAPLANQLSVHPIYLLTAIGSGSITFIWQNSSAFWIISEIGGMTQLETLQTYTFVCFIISLTGMLFTLVVSTVFPL